MPFPQPFLPESNRRLVYGAIVATLAILVVLAILVGHSIAERAQRSTAHAPAIATCRHCKLKKPPRNLAWRYQLQGNVKIDRTRLIYDIDGENTSSATVRRIHRARGYAVCYVDVGTWENWRRDKNRFPPSLLGGNNGWPGERYLDIRQRDTLIPLMSTRFKSCRRKGFDAVEPDNVDTYASDSGFDLSAADQLAYNSAIARLAHRYKLAVGLKNDLDQAGSLVSLFDFAVVEECVQFNECERVRVFTRRRKPVLVVEYETSLSTLCSEAKRLKFSGLLQTRELNSSGTNCP